MEYINIKLFNLEEYLPLKVMEVPLINKSLFSCRAIENESNLIGNFYDYIEQNRIQKAIGEAGEFFVFKYEKECVKKYNLPASKQVKWVSKDMGDGFGYDILSYDKQGNEIFIEVKTTPEKEKTSFYITANELLKSQQEKENYYLYRVYNFDMKKKCGEISVSRGSLKKFCKMPQVYKVDFE